MIERKHALDGAGTDVTGARYVIGGYPRLRRIRIGAIKRHGIRETVRLQGNDGFAVGARSCLCVDCA